MDDTPDCMGGREGTHMSADNFPFLAPDIDMTTALSLPAADLTTRHRIHPLMSDTPAGENEASEPPSLGYSDTLVDYSLPRMSKSLRDELVRLYFYHDHHLCPVVDEFALCDAYFATDAEATLVERVDAAVLCAMMFVAFAALYNQHAPDDHYPLIQAALLLSYYSPYDADDEVNTFWVKQAFDHANALYNGSHHPRSAALSNRRAVVWWCCLTRDRFTTFGLRRGHDLQTCGFASIRTPDLADFGFEAVFPRFTDIEVKQVLIRCFIWLCKLSDIVRSIVIFTRHMVRREATAPHPKPEDYVNRVRALATQLQLWNLSYQTLVQDARRTTTRHNRMPLRILEILGESVTVSLYVVLVQIPPSHQVLRVARESAILKIRDAAARVNYKVQVTMKSARVEDFPQWLVAWVILPIVSLKAALYLNSVPAQTQYQDHMASMADLLSALHSRFGGVRYVANMIRQIDSMLSECYRLQLGTSGLLGRLVIPADESVGMQDVELDMLDFAIRLVELNLASQPAL
ncbi:hypothetical protein BJY00DRAFT_313238 [Aspergillus carlsbadensis]|nr:hypothetical protein BJY00DRAFT_313238 [Aspergillus carlsbadensis]